MTRQKSKVQNELNVEINADLQKPAEQLDLRSQFKALNPKEQEAVINFFNLHNAAIWIFTTLSSSARDYVNNSIELSQERLKQKV